jgi:FtsP/CotA-like multicopper oxidase with cupredoxin domain
MAAPDRLIAILSSNYRGDMLYMDNNNAKGARLSGQKALVNEADPGAPKDKKYDRRLFLKMTGAAAGTVAAASMLGGLSGTAEASCGTGSSTMTPLDPLTIPKYVNPLVIPPVYDLKVGEVKVDAAKLLQQILPLKNASGQPTGFGPTTVYAYGGKVIDPVTGKTVSFRHSPGATFLVKKGVPTKVEWINNISGPHFLAVDPTIHRANPNKMATPRPPFKAFPPGYLTAQDPVPMVTHLHGAEVSSFYDGGPNVWFTRNGKVGPQFTTRHYIYPNSQEATSMFYHDHAPGMTRLNVFAGLAGFWVIQDPKDRIAPLLPNGKYWLPMAIQDRSFAVKDACGNNELNFGNVGDVPSVHPYWIPEFFGDAIMVNGHTWPFVNVDRGQYRLTLLNGCNARFLNLFFDNGMSFVVIGSDGGYLQSPVRESSLILLPGGRIEILIDFSNIAAGTEIILRNNANAPYPDGDPADPNTVGQIIKFKVGSAKGFVPKKLPSSLNPTLCGPEWPALRPGGLKRIVTLNEQLDMMGNPLGLFLNGQMWDAPASETPKNGTTEDWYFVNLSGDAHPMHLHLVQFQIVSRQDFNADQYLIDWLNLNKNGLMNGMLPFKMTWKTKVLPFEPYLTPGSKTFADPDEHGWRDLVRALPGQVTQIRVRFKKQDGQPYPFDPTTGPGYVWHCHIVDHEDNEMMRPMIIKK